MQWIPGHTGVERNEEVDRFAQQQFAALHARQAAKPVTLDGVKTAVRGSLRKKWHAVPTGAGRAQLYGQKVTALGVGAQLSRRDETLLAQIRTGACPLVGPLYYHMRRQPPQNCRFCHRDPETPAHLLVECRAEEVLSRLQGVRPRRGPVNMDKLPVAKLKKVAEFFRDLPEV